MFSLQRRRAKMAGFNARKENHGDELVLACDLKFTVEISNDELAEFSPTLKSSLYQRDDAQREIVDTPDHLTQIKNPQIKKVKWEVEYPQARYVVHHGIDDRNDTVFGLAKIGKFEIEPKEGGTCVVGYRVQTHPTEEQVAHLATFLGEEVYVTLDPDGGDDPEDPDDASYNGGDSNDGYAPSEPEKPKRTRKKRQMDLVE
jgi:hypothetical protein